MELFDMVIENFGSYAAATVNLHKEGLVWIGGINKDTEAANSNGSGKSTVFKALTWCLYGETVDGVKGDKVIRNGTRMAMVVVRLSEGGNYWTITRSRTKGSPKLSLTNSHGKDVEGAKDTIQSEITELLGLDFQAFRNSVLYGQNDSLRFANPATKDAERKSMLHKIMRTDLLALCHDEAKKTARVVKSELSELESELQKHVVVLGECDVDGIKEQIAEWETERDESIEEHRGAAIACKKRAQTILKQLHNEVDPPDIDAIQSKIDKLQKGADAYTSVDLDMLLAEFEESTMAVNAAQAKCTDEENAADMFEAQLKRLGGDECSLCTAPLTTGAPKKLISNIRTAMHAAAKRLVSETKATQKAVKFKDQKRQQYTKAQETHAEYEKLVRRIANLKTTELHEAQMELVQIEQRVENIKREAKKEVDKARANMAAAKKESERKNPYLEQYNKAVAKETKCEQAIDDLKTQMDDKRSDLAHIEFWSKGFSNQGLPSYVLDSVMPFLTERANEYLDTLADGDISLEFHTQRELKSSKGAMRDEIEIQWYIEGNEGYPPSGGQLKKIEIATDLALMDLVAEREGSHLDLLMLDEVLDGLDEEGCARVYTLLQNLRARRGSIFVVSHEGKVGDIFEKAMFATKEDGITTLEV